MQFAISYMITPNGWVAKKEKTLKEHYYQLLAWEIKGAGKREIKLWKKRQYWS